MAPPRIPPENSRRPVRGNSRSTLSPRPTLRPTKARMLSLGFGPLPWGTSCSKMGYLSVCVVGQPTLSQRVGEQALPRSLTHGTSVNPNALHLVGLVRYQHRLRLRMTEGTNTTRTHRESCHESRCGGEDLASSPHPVASRGAFMGRRWGASRSYARRSPASPPRPPPRPPPPPAPQPPRRGARLDRSPPPPSSSQSRRAPSARTVTALLLERCPRPHMPGIMSALGGIPQAAMLQTVACGMCSPVWGEQVAARRAGRGNRRGDAPARAHHRAPTTLAARAA
jgi:hypothetical protein